MTNGMQSETGIRHRDVLDVLMPVYPAILGAFGLDGHTVESNRDRIVSRENASREHMAQAADDVARW